ncbi:Cof-type HAD-IIB family hydrolase [Deinococcus radiophilus]|uniref:Cof-type HAD-IIB family hydrolase n=1 Tax=Deinococcus radiophilus TaxID=32062 RepID=UPI001E49784D|nr:Cof-type HAD-IIB family hydrolase [Deinococcus radiophilus]UFA51115.1 Cof-type HAD-IIB family hydrolase [Deinococcus radiophilus]
MLQMICIDVDGTLVGSSNVVRNDVWEALDYIREAGVKLVLCSGRPAFGQARSYAERMQPGGWHVFQNGASVVRVDTGESLSSAFPAAALSRLLETATQTGRLLEIYSDSQYASTLRDEEAREHAELLGFPFPPLWPSELHDPVVRAQWLVRHGELDTVRDLTPSGLELHPAGSPRMRETLFVSMTAPGVSKGSAIRSIAQKYGIGLDRCMMVGDGENDLQAMAVVGHTVAMGNAEVAVLAAAQHRVGHVDEGGLIEALELARQL